MYWIDGELRWEVNEVRIHDMIEQIEAANKQLYSGKLPKFERPAPITIGPMDGNAFLLQFMMAAQYELSVGNPTLQIDQYFNFDPTLPTTNTGLNFVDVEAEVNGMKIQISDIELGNFIAGDAVALTNIPTFIGSHTREILSSPELGVIPLSNNKFLKYTDSNYAYGMTFFGGSDILRFNSYTSAYGNSGLKSNPSALKMIGGMFQLAWKSSLSMNFMYLSF